MRLIDIDTTYPLLKERLTWLGQYGDDVYRLACECIRGVMETQPTAYDVDKVVDMLEDFKDMELIDGTPAHGINEYKRICKCIEIVKSGAKQCGVYTKLRSARKGNCI